VAVLPQERLDFHGLEPSGVEVDDVHFFGRIALDFLGRGVGPQVGRTGRNQDGIVVADTVHGAGAEARHQPHEAVFALDARRPAEFVVRKRDARIRREEIRPHPGADDFLHHDGHLLVEIQQPPRAAVFDRIRPEHRGVDFGDGFEQGLQPLRLGAAVRQEKALVLARERRPHPVFQQAGTAHDDGNVAEIVQRRRQALHDVGREPRRLEQVDDVGILQAYLVEILVLLLVDGFELVEMQEHRQRVRRQIPGLGKPHAGQFRIVGPGQNRLRQKQPRALAAQIAAAAGRENDPLHQVVEIQDLDVLLRRSDVGQVAREEPADQRHLEPLVGGGRQTDVFFRQVLVEHDRINDFLERRADIVNGLDEEARALVLDPFLDGREDVVGIEVFAGQLEDGVAGAQHLFHRLRRDGRIGVFAEPLRAEQVAAADQVPRLRDAGPEQMVEHLPGDVIEHRRIGAADQVDDDPPLACRPAAQLLAGGFPLAAHLPQLAVLDGLPDAIGHGADELVFLFEETVIALRRHVLDVGHLDGADRRILHPDVRTVATDRRRVVARVVGRAVADDPRLADVRKLPTRRDDAHHALKHVRHRQIVPPQQLLNVVQAIQFLGPLAEGVQHAVQRRVQGFPVGSHGRASRPSRGS